MSNLSLIRFILQNKMKIMMAMLNNRNMQINILEIIRKSIITLSNKLQYHLIIGILKVGVCM